MNDAPPRPSRALGMFLGHTFIVTAAGAECCDDLPWELLASA
jgi:hypothetical protein